MFFKTFRFFLSNYNLDLRPCLISRNTLNDGITIKKKLLQKKAIEEQEEDKRSKEILPILMKQRRFKLRAIL